MQSLTSIIIWYILQITLRCTYNSVCCCLFRNSASVVQPDSIPVTARATGTAYEAAVGVWWRRRSTGICCVLLLLPLYAIITSLLGGREVCLLSDYSHNSKTAQLNFTGFLVVFLPALLFSITCHISISHLCRWDLCLSICNNGFWSYSATKSVEIGIWQDTWVSWLSARNIL